jgi:GDP-4-dehydro-6-deoxy-D-mannose reductase
VRDIVMRLVARADRRIDVETDPALLRPVEVPVLIGDPAKLRAATGWTPERTLDDTLDAVLAEARQGS